MNKTIKKNRDFGYVVGGFLFAIFVYRYFKTAQLSWPYCAASFALLFTSIIIPRCLTSLRLLWETIGEWLGYVNSLLILTLIYFFIITPLGVISRLLAKDPLKLKTDKQATTYWEPVDSKIKTVLSHQF
ncbi:SxtJ family membrane protein [Mucilaginibacter polytrichastri]|uniref:SxtJ n=1 Tax=Mucilaginibacter polytrichastri TaxID=1302689 RepID=A0A1Q5ZS20_9SPHI|nr:SxtJ family membrane protein [Mucilaginibacter polytrichastri]OKS84547.1 hypothetical protein RG47T_5237 [Mucilaginibacter polytrichastri]SFT23886.1 hypothetical protein SAMN04487890_12151 [Mucilaginibacter polytrichastri]